MGFQLPEHYRLMMFEERHGVFGKETILNSSFSGASDTCGSDGLQQAFMKYCQMTVLQYVDKSQSTSPLPQALHGMKQ